MIRKGNKMLQISVPKEIADSMDKVSKAISKKMKRPYTKGMLVSDIYAQWLVFQNAEIKAASEQIAKEEKKNA
ncbi:hypothetical protein [Methanobrevibacter sp.]|uniref:hypothetical protein n=1 Tax=Methanobrevibacter sp. TaxID=66852 RepID=UPI00389096FE